MKPFNTKTPSKTEPQREKYLLELNMKEAKKLKVKGPKLAKVLQGIGRTNQSGQGIDPDLIREESKKQKGQEMG